MAQENLEPGRPAGPYDSRRSFLLKRLLPLLLLGAVAAWFFRSSPRDIELVFDLSARSEGLRRLEVVIYRLPELDRVRSAEFLYEGRAVPAEQSQSVKLTRGQRYSVEARLFYPDRTETVTRVISPERETRITLRL